MSSETPTLQQLYEADPALLSSNRADFTSSYRTGKLDTIPLEVSYAILDQLPSTKDRKSLSQVSRPLYQRVVRSLFETFILRVEEEVLRNPDFQQHGSLDAGGPLQCFQLVKHLHLRALFHDRIYEAGCPHWSLSSEYEGKFFAKTLIPLLKQLAKDSLKSFRYALSSQKFAQC